MSECQTSILLGRWHGGDSGALDELLRAHHEWLHHEARRCLSPALRDRQESLDLAQDAVVEFLQDAPRFRIDDGNHFRALLRCILERQ